MSNFQFILIVSEHLGRVTRKKNEEKHRQAITRNKWRNEVNKLSDTEDWCRNSVGRFVSILETIWQRNVLYFMNCIFLMYFTTVIFLQNKVKNSLSSIIAILCK